MGAGRIRRYPWLARCGLAVAAFVLAARLGDELLRFLLLDCPPAYWLPSHAPHRNVTAIVGSIRAEWTTNSLGFHDREHAIAAPSGARRLVCIGDSFLEGPAQETLPAALERRLAPVVPGIEAINLSACDTGPEQYLALLREIALPLRPDVVRVFVYLGNDLVGMEGFSPAEFLDDTRLFARPPRRSWLGTLLPRTAFVAGFLADGDMPTRFDPPDPSRRWPATATPATPRQLAKILTRFVDAPRERIQVHLAATLRDDEMAEACSAPLRVAMLAHLVASALDAELSLDRSDFMPDPETASAQTRAVTATLRAMDDLSRAQGVDFGVVLIPTMMADPRSRELCRRISGGREHLFEQLHERTSSVAGALEREGLRVFELAPAFAARPGGYLRFDCHWNEEGVAIAADFLAERLAQAFAIRR